MLEKIENFFVRIIYTLGDFANIIVRFHGFNGIYKLNIKTSDNLIVLGNGSSLNEAETKIKSIEPADYMVVNRHVLSDAYTIQKPLYYVLADPHFFTHPEGKDILERIIKLTSWKMYLFLPYACSVKKIAPLFTENKNISIQYYNSVSLRGFDIIRPFFYRHNMAMPKMQNVLVACIYLGIFLHYKNVYLFGVEHSWTRNLSVNDKNEVCLDNPHFYDKSKNVVKTWKEIQGEEAHIHEVLRKYANMFESYWGLQKIAQKENVKITNCTKDSFIDAFPK